MDYDDDEDYEEYDNYYRQSKNKKILMVAEKNSIAEAIAFAIGNKPSVKKGKVCFYYFQGQFRGEFYDFIVTATNGHLYNRDFPSEYSDWKKVDPIELFNAKTVKKPANLGAVKAIQRVSKGIAHLILWLDNDREGENICFEVSDICKQQSKANVLRAKFSSITSNDLRQAFNQLNQGPNLNESMSVDARQILDLKIGVAFSRFQTMYFNQKYQTDQLVTFGPCQTPTLGFCVQRQEQIVAFVPKTYFTINLSIVSQSGFKQEVEWLGQEIWKEQEAKQLVLSLQKEKTGAITQLTSVEKSKPRPEGINTVAMLKFASSCLGLGPQQAMHIAERLYLSGFISYPRTESTAFPQGFPTQQIVRNLLKYNDQDISKHCQWMLNAGISASKKGVDVGDHPPITPTENVPHSLTGAEKGLYEYVTKMFLASHSGDCIYQHSTLKFTVLNSQFKYSANQVIEQGFTRIATWLKMTENTSNLKNYVYNNIVKIGNVDHKIQFTSPPDYLTETELISLMDKNRIGTDASMATHINNICERQYVKVEGANRKLVPTDLGLALVKGYKKIDPDLVSPQLRSNIENQVDQIAKGKAKFESVIDEVLRIFIEKYKKFRDRISEMEILHFSKASTQQINHKPDENDSLSKCGICQRFMTLSRNQLSCEKCNKVYPLLPNCKYKVLGNQQCPLDKFQLIHCQSLKSPFISTFICPKCFSDSPILKSDQCVCNLCPAQDCPNSIDTRLVGLCKNCSIGDLVLEPFITKGQQISISCNECWCLYQLVPAVLNVSVLKIKQCQCKLNMFKLEMKDEAFKTNDPICIFCNEQFKQKLLFANYGYEKKFINQQSQQTKPDTNKQQIKQKQHPQSTKRQRNYDNKKQYGAERNNQQTQSQSTGMTLADFITIKK